jgi:hypothetical protein
MEFFKLLDCSAPGLIRHAETTDQFRVGDEELVLLVLKCFGR